MYPDSPRPEIPHSRGVDDLTMQRALGISYPLDHLRQSMATQDYSERRRIVDGLPVKIEDMRKHRARAAIAAGLDIPDHEMNSWQPTEAELRQALRAERIMLQMLDGLEEYLIDEESTKGLHLSQLDALWASYAFLELAEPTSERDGIPGKGGYIDKPTGTGKTGTFAHLVRAIKSKEDRKDPVRVLVLAPTNAILRQTIGRPMQGPNNTVSPKKGFAKFTPDLNPTIFNQDEQELSDLTVMTNASFNQLVSSGQMPHFDLIIVDETHTGLGENISNNLRVYGAGRTVIGFTATPEYHDEKRTRDLLPHEIYSYPLIKAIKDGGLAPAAAVVRDVIVTIDEAGLPNDPAERRAAIRLAYFHERLKDAMPDIRRAIEEGNGVIIRCPDGGDTELARVARDILQAESVTARSGYQGKIKAAAVGGSRQNAAETDLLLHGFNNKQVHAICYVDLLNMGADLPPGKLFVNLAPSESRVVMVQCFGRILRLVFDKLGSPVQATMIDYVAPSLKNQYTGRDVLMLKPGQSGIQATGQGYQPLYMPQEYAMTVEAATVTDVTINVIGTTAVAHAVDVAPSEDPIEDQSEPDSPETKGYRRPDTSLTITQVARWLGTTQARLEERLAELGTLNADVLQPEEVLTLVELYPDEYYFPDAPPDYISVAEAATRLSWRGSSNSFFKDLHSQVRNAVTRFRTASGPLASFLPRDYFVFPDTE